MEAPNLEALTCSNYLADSDLVPKDFKGKPGNCLIAMQRGSGLGLQPLQSLQNLAVINGRPALWGDAMIALVLASPVCECVTEGDDGKTAYCRFKRKGSPAQVRSFSMEDAMVKSRPRPRKQRSTQHSTAQHSTAQQANYPRHWLKT